MKHKASLFASCFLFLTGVVSAQMGYNYYEPHTMMYYGSSFGYLNSILITVVLVLLIIYLVKLIMNQGRKRK